jgi:serine kinase of HPr protein (carbohydrate metabolism regulator)
MITRKPKPCGNITQIVQQILMQKSMVLLGKKDIMYFRQLIVEKQQKNLQIITKPKWKQVIFTHNRE